MCFILCSVGAEFIVMGARGVTKIWRHISVPNLLGYYSSLLFLLIVQTEFSDSKELDVSIISVDSIYVL